MVLSLRMPHQLRAVEVHVPQVARDVALRLVGKVDRARVAAFAARRDRLGPHAVAEFDHGHEAVAARAIPPLGVGVGARDRKSTRLNSSHSQISYAVFCLKKKKKKAQKSMYVGAGMRYDVLES